MNSVKIGSQKRYELFDKEYEIGLRILPDTQSRPSAPSVYIDHITREEIEDLHKRLGEWLEYHRNREGPWK